MLQLLKLRDVIDLHFFAMRDLVSTSDKLADLVGVLVEQCKFEPDT